MRSGRRSIRVVVTRLGSVVVACTRAVRIARAEATLSACMVVRRRFELEYLQRRYLETQYAGKQHSHHVLPLTPIGYEETCVHGGSGGVRWSALNSKPTRMQSLYIPPCRIRKDPFLRPSTEQVCSTSQHTDAASGAVC